MPLYRATATTLANLVGADGASGGFVKDSEVSTFARTYLNLSSGRATDQILGTWHVLAQSSVATTRNSVNGAGDATEATLVTVTIPAGALGANGRLRVTLDWTYTNSASTKNLRARLNGLSGTTLDFIAPTTTAYQHRQFEIGNVNSASSQVGAPSAFANGGWGTSTSAMLTAAIDTTAAVDLVFTTAWGASASAESISLSRYLVELLYAA